MDFGPGGETCLRLNSATAPAIFEELLERTARAIGAAR